MVQINPLGVILVLVGLPGVIWPYRAARLDEVLDAIGSKRSMSEVEPAGWRVMLTRVASILFVLFGLAMTFSMVI